MLHSRYDGDNRQATMGEIASSPAAALGYLFNWLRENNTICFRILICKGALGPPLQSRYDQLAQAIGQEQLIHHVFRQLR
jgi:hypothetical protein